MKLEEMSAEELVRSLMSFSWVAGSNDESDSGSRYKPELLSRLTRGDKAIKAMEKIDKIYINHRAYDEYVDSVRSIIQQYRRES